LFQTLAKVVDGWKKHETEKVAIINQLKVERENAEQSQQRQQEVTSGTLLIWLKAMKIWPPPKVQLISGQKPSTKIIYTPYCKLHCMAVISTECLLQKESFLETPKLKTNVELCMKHLKVLWSGGMKLFLPVFAQFLRTLNSFSRVPRGNCFCCFFR